MFLRTFAEELINFHYRPQLVTHPPTHSQSDARWHFPGTPSAGNSGCGLEAAGAVRVLGEKKAQQAVQKRGFYSWLGQRPAVRFWTNHAILLWALSEKE